MTTHPYTIAARATVDGHTERYPLDDAGDAKLARTLYRKWNYVYRMGGFAPDVTTIELLHGDQVIATTDQEATR